MNLGEVVVGIDLTVPALAGHCEVFLFEDQMLNSPCGLLRQSNSCIAPIQNFTLKLLSDGHVTWCSFGSGKLLFQCSGKCCRLMQSAGIPFLKK